MTTPEIISSTKRRRRRRANPDHPLPIMLEVLPSEVDELCKAIRGARAEQWRARIRYAVAGAEAARRLLRGEHDP